jgi:putative SOS response-associated peptidase YedK
MCSRYFLDADGNVIAFTFSVPLNERVRRRFNIAPTQQAPVIRATPGGGHEMAMLRWGLVPAWARDIGVGTKMINARGESAAEKPAFREAMAQRRCLVPASGFFEWKGTPGRKQPYAITLPDRPLFAFAGLWESWRARGGGEPIETFTIVTTDPNEAIARIHDRMPVILPKDAEEAWLHGDVAEASELAKPYEGPVALRAVSRVVSNVNNDVPECLADAGTEPGAQGELL